jgi:hypothetical protein
MLIDRDRFSSSMMRTARAAGDQVLMAIAECV